MGKHYDREYLLYELKRFYKENDRIPKSRELNNSNGYPNWISYRTYFGSLRNALVEAGLPIDTFRIRPKKYSNMDLLNLLVKYKSEFGKYPTFSDLNKRGKVREYPHIRTYEYRFGTLPNAIELAESMLNAGEHSDITFETIDALVESNRKMRISLSKDKPTIYDKLSLTLNEINHLIKALENIYCGTCQRVKNKLIKISKEF